MPTTGKMTVDLMDSMGSDLTVVNAARVSFSKISKYEEKTFEDEKEADTFARKVNGYIDYDYVLSDRWFGGYPVYYLNEKDQKLIQYLARHGHWTPFGHVQATFLIKTPIFVARQLGKHQVGLVWNEVSRRYVDSEPEFYVPETWRKRAENVKQGSSEEAVDPVLRVRMHGDQTVNDAYTRLDDHALDLYNEMLDHGVCPEQARMVLPQSMMTEWYWTGSLAAFARVCKLRLDPHTQQETREVAKIMSEILEDCFPVSWKALLHE
jgi:thymidylate synthase (FAD)